jgi:polyisoprenoid-binding protein YceI
MIAAIACAALMTAAQDGAVTYYFGASEARTTITFDSKTDVMDLHGTTKKISGSATIDEKAGKRFCRLVVPVKSMSTGDPGRDEAMRRDMWLDEAKYPTLEFRAEQGTLVKPPGTWKVDGQFTMHGVTRDLSLSINVTQIPEALGAKLGPGQWIRINTRFQLKLSDFGIKIPPGSIAQVSDTWAVEVTLFGTTEKPAGVAGPDTAAQPDGAADVKTPEVVLEGAAGTRYKFGRSKKLTNLSVSAESELEKVNAYSLVIGGVGAIDEAAGSGKLKLSLPVAALQTGSAAQDELLRGPKALDAAKFPEIQFESTKLAVKDKKTFDVGGNLTIRGRSKPVTLSGTVKALDRKTAWDVYGMRKDGLLFSGTFKVKLSDFGFMPEDLAAEKIGDEWTVTFTLGAIKE